MIGPCPDSSLTPLVKPAEGTEMSSNTFCAPHQLCPAAAAGKGGGQEKGAEPDGTTGPPAAAETSAAPPLRSVHTTNFPALLDQLGISLLVTTYQAGKLVGKSGVSLSF